MKDEITCIYDYGHPLLIVGHVSQYTKDEFIAAARKEFELGLGYKLLNFRQTMVRYNPDFTGEYAFIYNDLGPDAKPKQGRFQAWVADIEKEEGWI